MARHTKTKNMNDFFEKVLKQFDEQIIDTVFLFIQHDRNLMREYLDTLANAGNRFPANPNLAKTICEHYGLKTTDERCNEPKSLLIQSYEKLKK